MSYSIEVSKSFKKAFKKLDSSSQSLALSVMKKLADDEPLPPKNRDHALKGKYQGFRECHIKPDLLLIYKKQESVLVIVFVEVGGHSDLF